MSIYSILGATSTVGTGMYVYDSEKKCIDKDKAKTLGKTSLVTGATTTTGGIINHKTQKDIYKTYASEYVASMSDQQLVDALIALDELEAPEKSEESIKTI